MTNHQKIRDKFIKRYGGPDKYSEPTAWRFWLGIYEAGWADAQEQTCSICDEPIPVSKIETCRKCHFGKEKNESNS